MPADELTTLQRLTAQRDRVALETFLADRSNLPGPRGNLALAAQAADALALLGDAWVVALIDGWSLVGVDDAGGNEPRVMLPFIAAQAAGALWQGADTTERARLDTILRRAANDPRWRVREGVAMGLQRIGFADWDALRRVLDQWASGATLLEWRAIVGGLAEPPLLSEQSRARYGLEMVTRALAALLLVPAKERSRDEPRALRAALGYGISVFLVADPGGFDWFASIAASNDVDVRWIVRENLKKARIAKRYPQQCAAIAAIVNG